MSAGVSAEGLDQLVRQLAAAADQLGTAATVAAASAARLVADAARPRIPRRSGDAASSLIVQESPASAVLAAGGSRAPYYGFVDFGGRVGRRDATLRPYVRQGRYLYPGLESRDVEITQAAERAAADVLRSAGLEVT